MPGVFFLDKLLFSAMQLSNFSSLTILREYLKEKALTSAWMDGAGRMTTSLWNAFGDRLNTKRIHESEA
jgi:hypothetical protein